jgi:hypothetical protein
MWDDIEKEYFEILPFWHWESPAVSLYKYIREWRRSAEERPADRKRWQSYNWDESRYRIGVMIVEECRKGFKDQYGSNSTVLQLGERAAFAAREFVEMMRGNPELWPLPVAAWPMKHQREVWETLARAERELREFLRPWPVLKQGEEEEAPATPAVASEFAKATDTVPGAYCDEEGKAYGPLAGSAKAVLRAFKSYAQPRREDLLRLHQSGEVWVRELGTRSVEVFFRTKEKFNEASKNFKPDSKRGKDGK